MITSFRNIVFILLVASAPLIVTGAGVDEVQVSVAEPTPERSETVPNIISELSATFDYGQPFNYRIVADNEALGYSVAGLPAWIKRKGAVLYGNAVESGTFKLQIRALNMKGLGPSKELTIIVSPQETKTLPTSVGHQLSPNQ